MVTSDMNQSNHAVNYECDFGQTIVNGLLIYKDGSDYKRKKTV